MRKAQMMYAPLLLLLAKAAGALTDQENLSLADLVSCPFVAAHIKRKRLIVVDGQWTRDQAGDSFDRYMTPVFGDQLFTGMAQDAARNGILAGFFSGDDPSPMPWVTHAYLHATHTGIHLSNISGQPDAWKLPCGRAELGNWTTDPSCGEPGAHPEVFDRYAAILEKGEEDTWSGSDLRSLCTHALDLMYVEGHAHPTGGVGSFMGSAGCKGVYTASHLVFGDITTAEWRAFLINRTYPASYVAAEATRVASASPASRSPTPGLLWTAMLPMVAALQAGYLLARLTPA